MCCGTDVRWLPWFTRPLPVVAYYAKTGVHGLTQFALSALFSWGGFTELRSTELYIGNTVDSAGVVTVYGIIVVPELASFALLTWLRLFSVTDMPYKTVPVHMANMDGTHDNNFKGRVRPRVY